MKLEINSKEVKVNNICTDSRKVRGGDLFIAYKGVNIDGHKYIQDAVNNGAKVIAGEIPLDKIDPQPAGDFKYFRVKSGREFWAEACAQLYGYPQKKLETIGITGTDGKTTTSNLLYHILVKNGKKAGLISTTSVRYLGRRMDSGLHVSTPNPDSLFRILKNMSDSGVEIVVLETTSHALRQRRVHGIQFICSGITNVSPEHIDLHGSYDQLLKDKSSIARQSKITFLNKPGAGYKKLLKLIKDYPENSKLFTIEPDNYSSKLPKNFEKKFPGKYNIENAAMAIKLAAKLGIQEKSALKSLATAKPPKGRFQKIKNKLGINLVVDFAHTDQALEALLRTVSKLKKGNAKIITVFGAAGERDFKKRPRMGKIASEYSDITILTSEDPRSENPKDIINQIVSGAPNYAFIEIADRASAIKEAILQAGKDDYVLILGKGHEKSMNINGTEHPWSDYKTAVDIIA